jgi:hypothetical protein
VLYSLRVDHRRPVEGHANLTSRKELLEKLDEVLKQVKKKVLVEYNAHRDLEDGTVLDLLAELERRRDWFRDIYTGVREK